uniref:Uncharacterized protein n=1 Tax=Arundo donax TaxID=35708 RepID=A0A0A9EVB6_ARUDO
MYDMYPTIERRDADAGGEPEEAPDEQQRPLGRRAVPELIAVLLPPRGPRLPAGPGRRSASVRVAAAAAAPVREPAVQVPQQLAHAAPTRGLRRVRVRRGRQSGPQRLEVAPRHGARRGDMSRTRGSRSAS